MLSSVSLTQWLSWILKVLNCLKRQQFLPFFVFFWLANLCLLIALIKCLKGKSSWVALWPLSGQIKYYFLLSFYYLEFFENISCDQMIPNTVWESSNVRNFILTMNENQSTSVQRKCLKSTWPSFYKAISNNSWKIRKIPKFDKTHWTFEEGTDILVPRVSDLISGGGFIWFFREIDLCSPSSRAHLVDRPTQLMYQQTNTKDIARQSASAHPSRGVSPLYWEAFPHPHSPPYVCCCGNRNGIGEFLRVLRGGVQILL